MDDKLNGHSVQESGGNLSSTHTYTWWQIPFHMNHWPQHGMLCPISSILCKTESSKSICPCPVCLVAQSCPTLCNPIDCSPPGSSVHGNSPRKNIGEGFHALLQGIYPSQGSKPGLQHCREILYSLSHQGSPHAPGFSR